MTNEYFEGDVVMHQDGDLAETVESVEVVIVPGPSMVTFLRTSRRFRPASEFTFTGLSTK